MLQNLGYYLRGVAMGAADVVPGVSGGTIAFITGIYEKLLMSIQSFNVQAFQLLINMKWRDLWLHINGTFLVFLFAGIGTSIISLARLIGYLMLHHPIPLWSFFCGLIVVSVYIVFKELKTWNFIVFLFLISGIISAYLITTLSPTTTPDNYIFLFFSGVIAICAMILPGVSGSFLLLIMGKYEQVLEAVKNFDIASLIVFAGGCIVGLLTFSRLVSWTLKNYYHVTVAALGGIMIGSINKIWPWKEVLQYRTNSRGEEVAFITQNILPRQYAEIYSTDAQIEWAAIFFLLAIIIVFVIDFSASKINRNKTATNH